jgi:predicted nucleic acid-binding Zn ribbon protein
MGLDHNCNIEGHVAFIGSTKCEVCGAKMPDPAAQYRCSKCGEIMAYNQTEHDLRRHRFG